MNPAYALQSISRTFHGRDLFGPAAAHLATGVPLAELGPPLDPDALVRLDVPALDVTDGVITATSLYVDGFGNIALNLDPRRRRAARDRGLRHAASRSSSPASATTPSWRGRSPTHVAGDVILYEDSYKNMSLAISRGSAARMLHAAPGQEIRISLVR